MADAEQLVAGSILEGPYWPEPVLALAAEMRNRRLEIHAVGTRTEKYFSDLFDVHDFETSVRLTPRAAAPELAATPTHFGLTIGAQRIRPACGYIPHFSMSCRTRRLCSAPKKS